MILREKKILTDGSKLIYRYLTDIGDEITIRGVTIRIIGSKITGKQKRIFRVTYIKK